jgi:nifR3 family TIM-barrel protein
MMTRHEDESILGVQLTGKSADETARAIEILDQHNFETIDLNMGCPVKKVVKQGCGSAILQDPQRVYDTIKQARDATGKVLTCKIRLGWHEKNMVEVAEAAEKAGAEWITVHGRTRHDDYSVAVDLEGIREVVHAVSIPVFGNGNIFSKSDAKTMLEHSGVNGVMVSRGALGDPWVFDFIKSRREELTVDEWEDGLHWHIGEQDKTYGDSGRGVVCLRKHLIWYAKGWPGSKVLRERLREVAKMSEAHGLIEEFANELRKSSNLVRTTEASGQFSWDPKWEMDRRLDRGVGDDMMEVAVNTL